VPRRASMACGSIPMYQPNPGAQSLQTPKPNVTQSTRGTKRTLVSKMGALVPGKKGPTRRDSNGFLNVRCETCGGTYKSASGNTTQCIECRPRNVMQTPAHDEHDVPRRVSMPIHLAVRTSDV
jgi:hypothetical protein